MTTQLLTTVMSMEDFCFSKHNPTIADIPVFTLSAEELHCCFLLTCGDVCRC